MNLMATNLPCEARPLSSFVLDTTNLTLASFSQLSKKSLGNLLSVYKYSAKQVIQARSFSNTILIYSLAITLFSSFIAYHAENPDAKKITSIVAFVACTVFFISAFASLVHTYQIRDFTFWQNVCVILLQQED